MNDKYKGDFLVDYIDKRVQIIIEESKATDAVRAALQEEPIWEDAKVFLDDCVPVVGGSILRNIKVVAQCTKHIAIDDFIKAVEHIHNEYRRTLASEALK